MKEGKQENSIKFSPIKDRIHQFIENEMLNPNQFYVKTGITRGILTQENGISEQNISKFLDTYPYVNANWLLTGRGEMILKDKSIISESYPLKTDHKIDHQRIPLYNIEATAGIVPLFENPDAYPTDQYLDIPNLPKCDGALFVTGDSMYPLLKSGDIIAYKQIHDIANGIFWGEMYLISINLDDEEYVTVKFIQKSDQGKEYIRLVSQNQHHQDKDIALKTVRKIALIKASVRINSMQ